MPARLLPGSATKTLNHVSKRSLDRGRDAARHATVVDQTWRYANRKGGPDRRFNDNRELPIGLYGKIDLRASNGVNQRIQCSRLKQAERFVASLTAMSA